jgi:LysR family hydrogen peroxide-inducible transcriptional activator
VREVSLVVQRDFVKERLVRALKEEILNSIPEKIRKNKDTHVVPLQAP